MLLKNLNAEEIISFKEAVQRGIGLNDGLFTPIHLPHLDNIEDLLCEDFVKRSVSIAKILLSDEIPEWIIQDTVQEAFNFPLPLKKITDNIFALELFWGPTLAFKDFGARLMAQMLSWIDSQSEHPTTILTATSGDTGAAVAHAFYGIRNIRVVILYPYNRISPLQEKMFCTLGKNIHTYAVDGTFDDCQHLVKQALSDKALNKVLKLNSANSINICRVLAQLLYYFEAVAQMSMHRCDLISVPCGNFGNLTAGLFAQSMGLPVSSFVASTNMNDTVPRYFYTGKWAPRTTVTTLSNAMDVSRPNNWPRIEDLMSKNSSLNLKAISCNEEETKKAMLELKELGYIAEPHSAIAYYGLKAHLKPNEKGVFLCTAHPSKFKKTVEEILDINLLLPDALLKVANQPVLSKCMHNSYFDLKTILSNFE